MLMIMRLPILIIFYIKLLNYLKKNDNELASMLFYVSDHGESLGENGLYLHGFPYALALNAQKQVPLIMWFSSNFKEKINLNILKSNIDKKYSHANIFHTVLSLMEVKTKIYDKSLAHILL